MARKGGVGEGGWTGSTTISNNTLVLFLQQHKGVCRCLLLCPLLQLLLLVLLMCFQTPRWLQPATTLMQQRQPGRVAEQI